MENPGPTEPSHTQPVLVAPAEVVDRKLV
jgi:hypothetical protein